MKPKIKRRNSDRDRVCRCCLEVIPKNEEGIVIERTKIGNKWADIWFHIECANDLYKRTVKGQNDNP